MEQALFLGTFPPRQCGIATFTADVVSAVESAAPQTRGEVIAVDEGNGQALLYPRRVVDRLLQHDRDAYRQMAARVNRHPAPVLNIQHEFGIFGGPSGAWLLDLLNDLRKPVVLTMHTVLPSPSYEHRSLVRRLSERVRKIVVLSQTARHLLETQYFIEPQYIEVIAHGIPDVRFEPTSRAKKALHMGERFVLSTFGLISRGKGLETAIDAVAQVAKYEPDVLYLILGATHPVVRRNEGESYRLELQDRVDAAGLSGNVYLIDRYFALEDLLEYLAASDVYVTPYVNEAQVVSGTLAYAVGAGKPVVSTPYLYARELLAGDRGMLVPFGDADAMAHAFGALLADEGARERMARRAYAFGRGMIWREVGAGYARLFESLAQPHAVAGARF